MSAPDRIWAKVHGASTDVISGQRGLIGGWNEHCRDGQVEYVRADLGQQQAVEVTPLEWTGAGYWSSGRHDGWNMQAKTPYEWLYCIDLDAITRRFSVSRGFEEPLKDFATAEAAQSAAEADHRERILSQITIRSVKEVQDEALTDAARDVLAERKRQIEVEGWTPEHDDAQIDGEIADAAGLYCRYAGFQWGKNSSAPRPWPWDDAWKPSADRRRDMVKAGALVLAEIERLDRAALKGGEDG